MLYYNIYPIVVILWVTVVISGLITTLISLHICRTGWRQSLKVNRGFATCGLLLGVPPTFSALLTWGSPANLGLEKLALAFAGCLLCAYAVVCAYRERKGRDFNWGTVGIMVSGAVVEILPWLISELTYSY